MCGCVCVYVDDLDHHDSDCDSEKARNVACCQRKTYGISCDVTTFVVRPRSLLHHAFGVGGGSPTPIPTPTFGTHNRDAHRAARARGQKSVGVGGEGKLPCPLLL